MRLLSVFHFARDSAAGRLIAFLLALSLLNPSLALGLPQGAEVESGDASFEQPNEVTLNITTSDQVIINWQSFSIGGNETVNFIQPAVTSIALNRVLGGEMSQIAGALNANGAVIIVNPAGINFAPTSQVQVAALVASSLNIASSDFLSSHYRFARDGTEPVGVVVNQGKILAVQNGYLLLLGGAVENTGTLTAEMGTVMLASGDAATLTVTEDKTVSVIVDKATQEKVTTADGSAVKDAVSNTGAISASGGTVKLNAETLANVFESAVNQAGEIEADSFVKYNGVIELVSNSGKVVQSGKVHADGTFDNPDAGHLLISGSETVQSGTATADAFDLGKAGKVEVYSQKGTWLLGGSLTSAKVNGFRGEGGTVLVNAWDGDTALDYGATIDVSAGAFEGDAGFIELSAKNTVGWNGRMKGHAASGWQGARLLIDPEDIVINNGGATNPAVPNNATGTPDVAFNDAGDGGNPDTTTIDVDDVVGFSQLFLQATRDITLDSALTMNANGSVRWEARRNITINANLTTSGTGTISLFADIEGNGTGDLIVGDNVTISTANQDISLQGNTIGLSTTGTSVNSGSGHVFLSQSANQTIGIGAGAGTFSITDGEIDRITTTGFLYIGNTDKTSGAMALDTVSAGAKSLVLNSGSTIDVSGFSSTGNLSLFSLGAITDNGGNSGASLDARTFADAGAAITLDHAANDFDTVLLLSRNLADNAAASGAVTYTDADGFNVDAITTTGDVTLTSVAGDINDDADDNNIDITGATLTLTANAAGAGIGTGNGSLDTDATSLTLDVGSGGANMDDYGSVILNASTFATNASLGIAVSDHLTVAGNLALSGTGTIALVADWLDDAVGDFTINTGVTISTVNGSIDLEGDDFIINGTGAINAGSGDVTIVPATAISVGIGTGAGDFSVSDAEIDAITTTGVLTIGEANTAGAVTIDEVTAGAKNVWIAANSTINDDDDTGDAIATTGTLTLVSNGAIGGLGGAQGLNIDVGTFNVNATGGNNVTITDSGTNGGTTLNSVVTGGAGAIAYTLSSGDMLLGAVSTTGNVALTATTGDINDTGDNGDTDITGATLTLTANASGKGIGAGADSFWVKTDATALTLNVGSGGAKIVDIGAVTLNASTLATNAGLNIRPFNGLTVAGNQAATGTGTIQFHADDDADGAGTFTLNTGVAISTADQGIDILAADFVINGSGTINSGAGNINITPKQAGGTIGVGSGAGTMSVSDAEIDAITTTGFLFLGNGDTGAMVIDGVTADAKNIGLITNSTINDSDDSGDAIVTTGTLELTSNGIIGGVNGAQGLNIDVGTFVVNSTGGNNVTVTDSGANGGTTLNSVATGGAGTFAFTQAAGDMLLGSITTTGNVALTATTGNINDTAADGDTDITGATLTLTANASGKGISDGYGGGLYTDATSLTLNVGSGGAFVVDIVSATLNASTLAENASLRVYAFSDLTIAGDQATTGTGTLTFFADDNNNGSGTFTINTGVTVSTQYDTISLAGADFAINGTGAVSGPALIHVFPKQVGRTVGIGTGAGSFSVSDAEIGAMTGASIKIGSETSGAVTVDDVDAGSKYLQIVTNSTINDSDDTGDAIVTTGTLKLTSNGAIGGQNGAEGLNVDVGYFNVASSGGNNITATDSGANGDTTLTTVLTGGAGNISYTQEQGNLYWWTVATTGTVNLAALNGSVVHLTLSELAADEDVPLAEIVFQVGFALEQSTNLTFSEELRTYIETEVAGIDDQSLQDILHMEIQEAATQVELQRQDAIAQRTWALSTPEGISSMLYMLGEMDVWLPDGYGGFQIITSGEFQEALTTLLQGTDGTGEIGFDTLPVLRYKADAGMQEDGMDSLGLGTIRIKSGASKQESSTTQLLSRGSAGKTLSRGEKTSSRDSGLEEQNAEEPLSEGGEGYEEMQEESAGDNEGRHEIFEKLKEFAERKIEDWEDGEQIAFELPGKYQEMMKGGSFSDAEQPYVLAAAAEHYQGENQSAEANFFMKEAFKDAVIKEETVSLGMIVMEMVNSNVEAGDVSKAFAVIDDVSNVWEGGDFSSMTMDVSRSAIYSKLGDHEAAAGALAQAKTKAEALNLYDSKDFGAQAMVMQMNQVEAAVNFSKGDVEAAEASLQKAADLAEQLKSTTVGKAMPESFHVKNEMDVTIYQSMIDAEKGDTQSALAGMQKVYRDAVAAGWKEGQAQASLFSALVAEKGVDAAAGQYFEKALEVAEQSGMPSYQYRAHYHIGRRILQEGKTQDAIQHLEKAVNVIESLRSKVDVDSQKVAFMGDKRVVYETLVKAEIAAGQDEKAFQVAEQAKSRALIDLLSSKKSGAVGSDFENALVKREQKLMDKIVSMQGRTLDEGGKAQLAQLQREHGEVLDQIKQTNPELVSLKKAELADTKDIQALLDKDTALVEFFSTEDSLTAWVVTKEGIQAHDMPLPREQLHSKVQALRMMMGTPRTKELYGMLGKMNEQLMGPMASQLQGKTLCIVPDGPLHYLPFAALRSSEGKFLIEDHPIYYAPSANVLKFCAEKPHSEGNAILAFGNPNLGDKAMDLQHAQAEAGAIAEKFPDAKVYVGAEARETVAKEEMGKYDIVHFAVHGELDPVRPLSSSLRLAPDAANDGKLEVGEIFDIDLKTRLVVLSGCETGLGKVSGGDDVVGLTRGFMYAGSPAVMATHWKVDDRATADLMTSFYGSISDSGKAQALQQAQIQTMKANEHPRYWASFFISGDGK